MVEPEAHTQIEDEERKSLKKDSSHTDHTNIDSQESDDSEISYIDKSFNDSKLLAKFTNIEKITPESSDLKLDKSDSETSSNNEQPSTDTD